MKNHLFARQQAGAVLAFVLPFLLFLARCLWDGSLTREWFGPDARLYLSIADNFLATGHFAQTTRPAGSYVVPLGVPLTLTLFRALHASNAAIVLIQHGLVSLSCLLLYLAERDRFGRGGFAPAVFCLALFRTDIMPDNIFVEHYYLPALCLILWLLSQEGMPLKKKLLWLNLAGFYAFVTRLVLLLVWLPILGYTLWCVIKKRFPLGRALILGAVFALILLGNAAVNCRETGHWIWMENYSGSDMYTANNPHTHARSYQNQEREEYLGEEYYAIQEDESLDPTEKNAALSALARQWIGENPGTFLKNTMKKMSVIFLSYWKGGTLMALVGAMVSLGGAGPERRLRLWELAVNFALVAATSTVLAISRYTLPIWPLASLHLAALAHAVLALLKYSKRKRTAAANKK
ncbi:MAG: hypothetical protein IKQ69_07125 [Oscillospiraceae bacterium]|nr:hypothetical protein [Oscillospiraceae bacterium]